MIYQLKVTLEHTGVWRRLLVDEEISFYQLHELMQIAFDWDDYHLHQFAIKDIPEDKMEEKGDYSRYTGYRASDVATIGSREFDNGWSDLYYDEQEETLGDWLYVEKDSCVYTYDFGDDWRHRIVLERMIAPTLDVQYPVCVKAVNEAPEEDSRGHWGGQTTEVDGSVIMEQINQRISEYAYSLNGSDFTERMQETMEDVALCRRLLTLAAAYNKLAPWEWMGDTEIFAVSDTATGEVGYCSILGGGQEVFGLAVYKGDQGLRTLLNIMQGQLEPSVAMYEQKSLLLSFEDRHELTADDIAQIQYTGVKFRGRKAWPSFRSCEPGYFPWYISNEEAAFMIQVLEQVMIVAQRVQLHPDLLNDDEDNRIFTRFTTTEGNSTIWNEKWLAIEFTESKLQEYAWNLPEIQQAALKKKFKQGSAIWECALFYAPHPIQEYEDDRPYYPQFCMSLSQQSGLVLGHDVIDNANDTTLRLQQHLVTTIEGVGSLPSQVLVENELAYMILLPLCQKLNIQLDMISKLPMMEHVREAMLSMSPS